MRFVSARADQASPDAVTLGSVRSEKQLEELVAAMRSWKFRFDGSDRLRRQVQVSMSAQLSELKARLGVGLEMAADMVSSSLSAGRRVAANLHPAEQWVNVEDEQGVKPLQRFTTEGDERSVEALLDNGADVQSVDADGWTALHQAAGGGHTEVVRSLVDRGADINCMNDDGFTPSHLAAEFGHRDTVMFLSKRALLDIQDSSGWSALHLAAHAGRGSIVKLLVASGATVDLRTLEEKTALHLASEAGHLEPVISLARNGLINAKDDQGSAPLHLAAVRDCTVVVELLTAQGAGLNVRNNKGRTPLHLAAEGGHKQTVEFLVDGALLDLKDNPGWTAVRLAASRGHREVVEFLLSKGASMDFTWDDSVLPPVELAAEHIRN